MSDLTVKRLREVLTYNPATGHFTWILRRRGVRFGCVAGSTQKRGVDLAYIVIRVDGRPYLAHRLAWFYTTGEWPAVDIDHDDRDGLNNRWANLRPATVSQNHANSRLRTNNTVGLKGVTFNKQAGRYLAQIRVSGKHYHLGLFDAPEDAHAAYVAAAKKHFGEFARAA